MPDSSPSLVAFPGLRLVSSCETERVLDLLTDDLLARRNDERTTELSDSHQRGGAALTTVEARGTTQPNAGCREHNRRGDLGRAAGAQLTGQRQDGPSQAPVCEQYPGRLTDGRGPFFVDPDTGGKAA